MLINLSSSGQKDPAKFSNFFSDGFVLPKEAVVCLIKGQITQDDFIKSITVEQNTTLRIRWDAYNIKEIILNPGGTSTYVVNDFVQYVNSLIPDTTIPGYGQKFEAVFDADAEDTKLTFLMYRENVPNNYADVMAHVYSNNNYKRFYIGQCKDQTDTLISLPNTGPGNTGIGALQSQIGRQGVAPGATTACIPIWDPAYIPPVNMPNRFAFQQSVINGKESFARFINGKANIQEVVVAGGRSAMESVNTATSGPYLGSTTISNPQVSGDLSFDLQYIGDRIEVGVWDNEDDQMVRVGYAHQNPNDLMTIEYNQIDPQHTTALTQFLYHPVIQVNYNKGLTFWLSFRGENNPYDNNPAGVPPVVPLDDFYMFNYTDSAAQMKSLYTSTGFKEWGITGTKRIAGYTKDVGANTAEPHPGGGFFSAIPNSLVSRSSPNAYSSCFRMKEMTRYTAATNNGPAQPNMKRIYRLANNAFPLDQPFAICCNISFGNDSLRRPHVGADNIQTWFANDTNPIIKFYLHGTTAGYDVEIRQSDGTTKTIILADRNGVRIPTFLGTYWVQIVYDGANASIATTRQIYVRVGDYSTGVSYFGTVVLTADLEPLKNIGGCDPTNGVLDYTNWCHGFFNDFRFYERTSTGTFANLGDRPAPQNIWLKDTIDSIWAIYRNPNQLDYLQNIQDNEFFFGNNEVAQLFPGPISGADLRIYTNTRPPNPAITSTVGFSFKPQLTAFHDPTWFEFLNVYIPNALRLPIAQQWKTGEAASYEGIQKGIVELLELGEELDFDDPPEDANNNVLEQPTPVGEGNTGHQNPIIDLRAKLEDIAIDHDVMNVEVTNLPHRSYNGTNNSMDKTIYQIPAVGADRATVDNLDIIEITPPNKVWIDCNNAMEIPMNKIDIQISDKDGKKLANLKQNTNITLEIRGRNNIL